MNTSRLAQPLPTKVQPSVSEIWNSPKNRLKRKLGRAVSLEASLFELSRLCEPFRDDALNKALRVAHGRLLEHTMDARKALAGLDK